MLAMTPFGSMKYWVGSAKPRYASEDVAGPIEPDRVAQLVPPRVVGDVGR